jgi:hypothetical protein
MSARRRRVARSSKAPARKRPASSEILGLLDDLDAKHGPVPDEFRKGVEQRAERFFKRKRR